MLVTDLRDNKFTKLEPNPMLSLPNFIPAYSVIPKTAKFTIQF